MNIARYKYIYIYFALFMNKKGSIMETEPVYQIRKVCVFLVILFKYPLTEKPF